MQLGVKFNPPHYIQLCRRVLSQRNNLSLVQCLEQHPILQSRPPLLPGGYQQTNRRLKRKTKRTDSTKFLIFLYLFHFGCFVISFFKREIHFIAETRGQSRWIEKVQLPFFLKKKKGRIKKKITSQRSSQNQRKKLEIQSNSIVYIIRVQLQVLSQEAHRDRLMMDIESTQFYGALSHDDLR